MAVYNISYDLRAPGRNYDDLYKEIKSLGSWAHPVESTWLVDSTFNVVQVRDRLKAKMDANDRLLVTICTKGSAWWNLHKDVEDWIRQRL
jgi:hypothetical protein